MGRQIQFTLKDMIYLLIFIVLIIGVLLHSLTHTQTIVSDDDDSVWDGEEYRNQVVSSDSGE